jgi:hypothetical protein
MTVRVSAGWARFSARRGGFLLGRETVAAAAHRLHQPVVVAGLQGAAQAADVHIHRALLDEDMVAPHLVEQLGAGMHPLRVGHQEMQQAELGRAEVHRLAVGGEAVGGRVEAQAADLDGVLGGLRGPAAQHGLDAGHQLAGREGLGDVVVGAGLEAGTLSCSSPRAVSMMSGMLRVRSSLRRRLANSTPDMPGSIQSSRIRSGRASRTMRWPVSASPARSTW